MMIGGCIGRRKSNNDNFRMICHATKPANGWEYALFYDKVKECYELRYSMMSGTDGVFFPLMIIDNLKDATQQYNDHVA